MANITKEQSIENLQCREKKCEFFDEDNPYSFCRAIFTENDCREKERNKRYFYALAEKYGFLAPKEYSTRIPSVEKKEN